ncbi:VWA domain-containing protein [Streptomyces sp. NPDC048338]|uniref:VWA domain-containing protein n=1 Tax=Streptomyces sp. NPDC048338 TaxID=3365536 RepID=UPI00371D0DC9
MTPPAAEVAETAEADVEAAEETKEEAPKPAATQDPEVTLPSPAGRESASERAAADLVAAAFDNPQIPQARSAEAEPKVVEAKPEAAVEADPEVVEAEAEAEVAVEPEVVVEPEPEVVEAEVVEAEAKPEAVEPEVAVEAKVVAEPEPEAEPELVVEAEPEAEPELVVEAEQDATEPTEAEQDATEAVQPEVAVEPEDTQPEPEATQPEAAEPEAAEPEPEAAEPEPEAAEPVAVEAQPIAVEAQPVAEEAATEEAVVVATGTPALSLARVKAAAPHLVDAYKAAGAALKKQGLTGARAAVYLVVDRSGSMRGYFKDGSVQRLAEQTVALAAHLDADAAVTAVFFSTDIDGTAELTPATLDENRIDTINAGLGRLGRTNYHRAIEEVLAHHEKGDPTRPAFVVFQTDGAPESKTAAAQALAAAAERPIHWQFVAWGEEDGKAFDFLRKLDAPHTGHFPAGPAPVETAHPAFYRGLLAGWQAENAG